MTKCLHHSSVLWHTFKVHTQTYRMKRQRSGHLWLCLILVTIENSEIGKQIQAFYFAGVWHIHILVMIKYSAWTEYLVILVMFQHGLWSFWKRLIFVSWVHRILFQYYSFFLYVFRNCNLAFLFLSHVRCLYPVVMAMKFPHSSLTVKLFF